MAKSLDGIKKLNPEEKEKYREIVLNYIGEKDSAKAGKAKGLKPAGSLLRRVDGVNLSKKDRFAAGADSAIKKPAVRSYPAAPAPLTLGQSGARTSLSDGKEAAAEARAREQERLEEAIRRQEDERRRIAEEERRYRLKKEQAAKESQEQAKRQEQEKIKMEQEQARAAEEKKLEEKMRREEAEKAERRRIKENKKLEKIKLRREKREARRKAKEKIRLEKEKIKQAKIRQEEIEKRKRESAEKKLREQRELIRQDELKKKEIADLAERQAEEIRQAEAARKRAEKTELRERQRAERRRIKENYKLEKTKRREEAKIIRRKARIAKQAAREKKKIKRRKAWKKFKRNFNLKISKFFSKNKSRIIYAVLFFSLFFALAYIIFCLLALRLKVDNEIFRAAENYLPVPAVITNQGIISNHDFRRIETESYLSYSLAERKKYLAKFMVLKSIREKYGLAENAVYGDLALKYALDKDFNQAGLSRINKISALMGGRGEIKLFGKYADEYNDGAYYDAEQAAERFGPAVSELPIGQISDVIVRADGYYIVERIADKNGRIGLRYLFIRARTLEQYVAERIEKIKVFILAD